MRIVITGAGGFVGAALARRLSNTHQVMALTHRDLDITDGNDARRVIKDARAELIINCAVLGVDECEQDAARAWAINVEGPRILAEAAAAIGAGMMHLSTNYVFDGGREKNYLYSIEDEPAPINIYGKTKLAGEGAVLAAAPQSYIVRTSWVFGVGKKSFLSTAHQNLLAGQRLRAITDTSASATYVEDLAARIEEIIAIRHFATYHVVNSGVCTYYEFALEAARILDMTDREARELIEPHSEAEMNRAAPRPMHTAMRCIVSEEMGLKPLRDWREALKEFIGKEIGREKRAEALIQK